LRKLLDMIVFVDESGDAGLKVESGSSTHFIFSLIIFNDKDEANKVDNHIDSIRQQLSLRKDFEFHFNKLSKNYREHFLSEVCNFDYKCFSFVIDKKDVLESCFETAESFYLYACKESFLVAKDYLSEAIVVIDGRGSRKSRHYLATYLKNNLNEKEVGNYRLKKVKLEDSHKNNLLQLADMICGAVARFYKHGKNNYYQIIKQREEIIEFWTKENSNPILAERTPYGDGSD
jgi:Protein of unknown function (DUF3800)